MSKPNRYRYVCPIRGELASSAEEEFYRIECINYLMSNKNVPRENIDTEVILRKYGSGGKNNLIADIVVYDRNKRDVPEKDALNHALYVAEIKKDWADKDKAIEYQLSPAFEICKKAKYAIYWDNANHIYRVRESQNFYSIEYMPAFNKREHAITGDDLTPFKDAKNIWRLMENKVRALGGSAKNKHKQLLKLIIAKYYDEKVNKEHLVFTTKKISDIKTISDNIKNLYGEALKYYGIDSQQLFSSVLDAGVALDDHAIVACAKLLEGYSFAETDRKVIQEFYMHFAPSFLRQELNQYYTPKEIVDFMICLPTLKNSSLAIDPCCGSADFMVGLIRRKNGDSFYANVHSHDIDEDATVLAKINMILNGDGRASVKKMDSLQENDKHNDKFHLVITNPPFGKNTTFDKQPVKPYALGKGKGQQVGILFIERNFHLLRKGGKLIIVLPCGYLENPSGIKVRDFIFSNFTILGCVLLPDGVFKHAKAGGRTCVLALQKGRNTSDYPIFIDEAAHVGFDHSSKMYKPLFLRNEEDGAFMHDQHNRKRVKNDLIDILAKFKQFSYDKKIDLEAENTARRDYSYVMFDEIKKENRLCAKRYLLEYKNALGKIKKRTTLRALGALVSNADKEMKIESGDFYDYIETGGAYRGKLLKKQKLRGWELPNRAKQTVKKDDIIIAKMSGSLNNFLYVNKHQEGCVVSNGFYKIRIKNDNDRLNFFCFLFSDAYIKQMRALATGTIMSDVKESDLMDDLVVPLDHKAKNIKIIDEYLSKQLFFDEQGLV